MADEKRHFDEELGFSVSPRFSEDLAELFTPTRNVPSNIDGAVVEAARRHLVPRQPKLFWIRWAVPTAAAAAVIAIASILFVTGFPPGGVPTHRPADRFTRTTQSEVAKDASGAYKTLQVSTSQADIDRNGRVDILDAFKLARHIESGRHTDGVWDVNGDGRVDRQDVDKVAFAAVRLDKGVL